MQNFEFAQNFTQPKLFPNLPKFAKGCGRIPRSYGTVRIAQ